MADKTQEPPPSSPPPFKEAPFLRYLDFNADAFPNDYLNDIKREGYKSASQLLSNDKDALALAKKIKVEPSPENISQFVALAERETNSLRHDLPGWSGNMFYLSKSDIELKTYKFAREYNPKNPDHPVYTFEDAEALKPEYKQYHCTAEAYSTEGILCALKDKGYLPPTIAFLTSQMKVDVPAKDGIGHYALAVFLDGKTDKGNPSFIIDPWQAKPGTPAPTFTTYEEWQKAANFSSRVNLHITEEKTEKFFASLGKIQTSKAPEHRFQTWKVERQYDQGYLLKWYQKNAPDEMHPYQPNPEAMQDMVMARFFMGDQPELPPETMRESYFKSLRDRTVHVLDGMKVGDGALATNIRKTKNFAELKPLLAQYYKQVGADMDVFRPPYGPRDAAEWIKNSDLNGNHRLDPAERSQLGELFKHDAGLLEALNKIGKNAQDVSQHDDIMRTIRQTRSDVAKPEDRSPRK